MSLCISSMAFAEGLIPEGPVPTSPINTNLKIHKDLPANQKNLIVMVDFSDVKIQNSESVVNEHLFGKSGKTVRTFYDEETNGKVLFGPAEETYGTVNDGIVKVSLDITHPGVSGKTEDEIDSEIARLIPQIVSKIDSYVNFAAFDKNNDGTIIAKELITTFLFAGYNDGNYPGIRSKVNFIRVFPDTDGVQFDIRSYPYIGEIKGDILSPVGLFCHEYGHCFGAIDLYPTVEKHSLMGMGCLNYLPGEQNYQTPAHMDPYSKILCGFIKPINANKEGIYTVNSLASASGATVLRINTENPKEYFLVENRQFDGFDASLYPSCGYGGIAIWHIDENNPSNNPGTNDAFKRKVDLEVANSMHWKLPVGSSPWIEPDDNKTQYHFYALGSGYTLFDDSNRPSPYYSTANSKTNSLKSTNISIEVLSPSGSSMQVRVSSPEIYKDVFNVDSQLISFTASSPTLNDNSISIKAIIDEKGATVSNVKFARSLMGVPQSPKTVAAKLVETLPNSNKVYEASFIVENNNTSDYGFEVTATVNNVKKTFNDRLYVNRGSSQNIALGKAVAASSEYDEQTANLAVNGVLKRTDNEADKWCSGYTNEPKWLTIDLGNIATINRWKVIHELGSGSAYTDYFTHKFRLQASYDNLNWKDIDTVDNSVLAMGITDRLVPSFAARYVRLYIDKADYDNCARIAEFQLFNDKLTSVEANFDNVNMAQPGSPVRKLSQPHYQDKIAYYNNTSFINNPLPKCMLSTSGIYHSSPSSMKIMGTDLKGYSSYSYHTIYENLNLEVKDNTVLSYWLNPQNENGRYVGVDIIFTNGQVLRSTGAVDQNGISMHPANARGTVGKWSLIKCNLGNWCRGLVIKDVLLAYDQSANTGLYNAYVDDIVIRDETVLSEDYSSFIGVKADFEGALFVNPTIIKPFGNVDYLDNILLRSNTSGYNGEANPSIILTSNEKSKSGNSSLLLSGNTTGSYTHYCYFNIYDNVNIQVKPTTKLSYWMHPNNENGRYIGVDILFTDGTWLRSSSALDLNGLSMHPNVGKGVVGQWNFITSQIGDGCANKTIKSILVAYDKPGVVGQFSSYIDDITITD